MKIPKRFQLMGQIINVIEDPALMAAHNWAGSADYTKNEIAIIPASPSYPAAPEKVEATFYHELAHFLFYYAQLDNTDEKAVDIIGCLLHQALKTMEYDNE